MTTALEVSEGSASRPGRSLPPGKTRYPLYRRLGGPQGRSGQVRKISPPPGFDSRTVQSVAQSLYRLSYPARVREDSCVVLLYCGVPEEYGSMQSAKSLIVGLFEVSSCYPCLLQFPVNTHCIEADVSLKCQHYFYVSAVRVLLICFGKTVKHNSLEEADSTKRKRVTANLLSRKLIC